MAGVANVRTTIGLDEGDLEKIRCLVAEGKAASVSGFVRRAVGMALEDEEGWGVMLAEALERTGGPLTRRERAWADRVLAGRVRRGATIVGER